MIAATVINLKSEKTNAHSSYIPSVAISPDGKAIVSGSHDETIKVWGERPLLAVAHPNYRLTAPCLLADASSLALVTEKANAHSSVVTSVQFSPDGTLIVSGSYDQTIKVWDSGANST